jgi:class 3 adenylate cyclase
LQILAELGVSLDAQPSRARVAAAVLGTRFRLNRRTDDELLSLPVIKDERTLAALRILVTIGIPAFTTSVNLSVLIIVESWRLTVRHGHHPHAPYVYSGVGVVLAAALRDYDAAYRCGRIAYRLVDRLSVKSMRPRVTQSLQTFVNPWSRPLQDVTAELMRGYQTGLETGDIEFGGFCTTTYFQYAFALARPLAHFTDEIDAVDESLGSHATARTYNQVYKQVAFNLQNATSDPAHLGGPIFDADQALEDRKENRDTWLGFSIHSNQQVLSYLFDEPDRAREEYAAALKYIEAAEGMYNEPMLKFFGVLTDLALFSTGSAKERATTERRAARALKRFRKLAERVPASFEAKAHLVEAELRRVAGDEAAARERYDRAIDSAREHAMKSDEALACELAGRFYMTRGQPRLGEYYLRAAHYAYSQWEAHAKTRHLERCYPQIRFTGNRDGVGADVDVRSLLKAAETISSTIELEALLENLLHVVIENAGAQSASILLERRGEWEVVAHQRGDPREDPTSEEVAKPFSSRIVAQVVRSKEPVLLANAAADPNYLDDLYVRATKPASVLCLPLVTQGRLTAIVYMENNLTAGAFTGESVQLLRMLSAQGAISIENARLYVKQVELTRSYSRFVPPEFLRLMGKPEITDLALGDHIGQEAAILFSDIRNFTTLSEGMAAGENFAFVNSYFDLVSPVIRRHSGVIVKYLGDGMMAVFPNGVDMAVNAAKDYAVQVGKFNSLRAGSGESPISFGIGIHVGDVVLGTVGEPERMQSDFFSDAVNLTARLESLTKQFNVSALVSREALEKTTEWPRVRDLGSALLHGKSEPVNLFELMLTEDRDPAVNEEFARALTAYQRGGFAEAVRGFEKVLELAPTDGPASYFRHRAALFLESGAPADWEGVERLAAK